MTGVAASPLGLLIGLVLGTLGGGGSALAVPVLVYVVGQSPQAATSTSLVIVALTSLGGVAGHWRAGHVRLRAGMAFGLAGIGGSLVGSYVNARLPPRVLLVTFAVLMVGAAAAMLRRDGAGTGAAARRRVPVATVTRVLLAGSAVGLLTGLFGVGGGFVAVPALVFVLGFAMPEAIGTSMVVMAVNAVTALGVRMTGGGEIDWSVAVPFTVAGLVGVVVGSAVADRVPAARLTRGFALLLIAVAAFMAVDVLVHPPTS